MDQVNEFTISIRGTTETIKLPWDQFNRDLLLLQTGNFNPRKETNDTDALTKIEYRLTKPIMDLAPILKMLPNKATIVDIGAGNSLLDCLIEKRLGHKELNYVLVDGNNNNPFDEKILDNISSVHYTTSLYHTYNTWEFVKKTISLNEFDQSKFRFADISDSWGENTCDLILSIGSAGWHYPIAQYLDRIVSALKPGGFLYINQLLNIPGVVDSVNKKLGEPFILTPLTYVRDNHNSRERIMLDRLTNLVSKDQYAYSVIWKKS